jgi:hypothetical protein
MGIDVQEVVSDNIYDGATKLVAENIEGVLQLRKDEGCDPLENARLRKRNDKISFLKDAALMGLDGKLSSASPTQLIETACNKPIVCDTLDFSIVDLKDPFKSVPDLPDDFIGDTTDSFLDAGKKGFTTAKKAISSAVDKLDKTLNGTTVEDDAGNVTIKQRGMVGNIKEVFSFLTPNSGEEATITTKGELELADEENPPTEQRRLYLEKWLLSPHTIDEWWDFPQEFLVTQNGGKDKSRFVIARDIAMGYGLKSEDVYYNKDSKDIITYPGVANRWIMNWWSPAEEPHPSDWELSDPKYGLYIDYPYKSLYDALIENNPSNATPSVDTKLIERWEKLYDSEHSRSKPSDDKDSIASKICRASSAKWDNIKSGYNNTMNAVISESGSQAEAILNKNLCESFCKADGASLAEKSMNGILGDAPVKIFAAGATNALSCMGFSDQEIVDVFRNPSSIVEVSSKNPLASKAIGDISEAIGGGTGAVAGVTLNAALDYAGAPSSGDETVDLMKTVQDLAKGLIPEEEAKLSQGNSNPCALNSEDIDQKIQHIEKDVINTGFAPPSLVSPSTPPPINPIDSTPALTKPAVTVEVTYTPQEGGRIRKKKDIYGITDFPVYTGIVERETMWSDGRFDLVRFYTDYVDVNGKIKLLGDPLDSDTMDKNKMLSEKYYIVNGTPTGCERPSKDYANVELAHEKTFPNRTETRYYLYEKLSIEPNTETGIHFKTSAGQFTTVLPPNYTDSTKQTNTQYF